MYSQLIVFAFGASRSCGVEIFFRFLLIAMNCCFVIDLTCMIWPVGIVLYIELGTSFVLGCDAGGLCVWQGV